ncbi:MAG: AzlC family ABC transporter permease [Syntrophobacteraceae bacterium]|nr:AzlC family ABC transporter permease [Syntrophobacteraceae bacterium]
MGMRMAWPICMAYFPVGMAFGVLAQKAGLGVLQTGAMSVVVFAGSAQFIGVSMLSQGASLTAIAATTFIVNLRHLLMSSALAPHLRRASVPFLLLFAYGVTDESFAVNSMRFRDGGWDRWKAIIVNHTANLAWVISSLAGAVSGQFIPPGFLGIDYAMAGMFLGLLVLQLRGRIYVYTAILSGISALGFSLVLPGNAYVIIASLVAATGGLALSRLGARRDSRHV